MFIHHIDLLYNKAFRHKWNSVCMDILTFCKMPPGSSHIPNTMWGVYTAELSWIYRVVISIRTYKHFLLCEYILVQTSINIFKYKCNWLSLFHFSKFMLGSDMLKSLGFYVKCRTTWKIENFYSHTLLRLVKHCNAIICSQTTTLVEYKDVKIVQIAYFDLFTGPTYTWIYIDMANHICIPTEVWNQINIFSLIVKCNLLHCIMLHFIADTVPSVLALHMTAMKCETVWPSWTIITMWTEMLKQTSRVNQWCLANSQEEQRNGWHIRNYHQNHTTMYQVCITCYISRFQST